MKKKKGFPLRAVIIIAVCFVVGFSAGFIGGKIAKKNKTHSVKDLIHVTDIEGINPEFLPVRMIGHRGLSYIAPENTLASFERAGQADYYGCEFDIHKTADGEWVVMHDENVKRMTDGSGDISSLSSVQIAALAIDSGNNLSEAEPAYLHVPTLSEALAEIKKYDMRPVIEIKSGEYADMADVCKTVSEYFDLADVCFIAFDYEYLREIASYKNGSELMYLVKEIDDDKIEKCVQIGAGIDFDASKNNDGFIAACIEKDVPMCAWTVDDPGRLSELYKLGVTMFTSNRIIP